MGRRPRCAGEMAAKPSEGDGAVSPLSAKRKHPPDFREEGFFFLSPNFREEGKRMIPYRNCSGTGCFIMNTREGMTYFDPETGCRKFPVGGGILTPRKKHEICGKAIFCLRQSDILPLAKRYFLLSKKRYISAAPKCFGRASPLIIKKNDPVSELFRYGMLYYEFAVRYDVF